MSATLILWGKHMRKLVVHKEELFGLLLQPVLWVVLFGTGMKSMVASSEPGGGDAYIDFMVPGIIALSALTGAIAGGSVLLDERLRGIIKEYLVAPVARLSILAGNAASTATKSLIQATVILLVGVAMGAQIGLDPLAWLGAVVLVAGYGLGFAGIGLAAASKAGSTAGYHMIIFMFNLPLLFMSNALYPLSALPTWMRIAAQVNPTTYVITGLRRLLMEGVTLGGVEPFPIWLCFVAVIGFAVFGLLVALAAFRSSIK